MHIGSLLLKNNQTDLYFGAFSGYIVRALVYDESNIYRDSLNYKVDAFGFGGIAGFRYLLNHSLGFYCETGFSRKFFIGGGVSIKIKSKNKTKSTTPKSKGGCKCCAF